MQVTPRTFGLLLIGAGTLLITGPSVARLFAQPAPRPAAAAGGGQDQAPTRREFTVTAKDYRFTPERLEVAQDDLVRLTIHSEDVAYSLTIDEYRVSKRVPAGGSTTFEFRADRAGRFPYYSNLTSDTRHGQTRGELVVRGK